ncbi:MAG: hypothetical protein N4A35_03080 [Flavobacteriales bacterium]|jgi:hypothetical protein|nr:hypothetical protein [Flavobacteriales bacterium]
MKVFFYLFTFVIFAYSCKNSSNQNNIKVPENLEGVEMHYTYSGGNEYAVKFEKGGMSYQYRTGGKPNKWWGKFPYNYMKTENNEHFVSWFEKGYGDYVTLLINYDQNILYGSAIIRGKMVHFQKAKIRQVILPE